eukprot:SAG31_NODE_2325_length_5939_cov_5.827940_4_plen_85_part_00
MGQMRTVLNLFGGCLLFAFGATASGKWTALQLKNDGKGFDTHDAAGCKANKDDDGGIPMCSVRDSRSVRPSQYFSAVVVHSGGL